MRFIAYAADKDRNYGLFEAIAEGARAHGDKVDIIDQRTFAGVSDDYDGAMCLGVKRAGKRLLAQHLQAGRHFLFFDKGYMARAQHVRVSLDAWQPLAYFRCGRSPERFERLGIRLAPPHETRKSYHVMFAGSSQKYCNFHDLGDATQYAKRVINKIKKKSSRPVLYRPKPSWVANHPEECVQIDGTEFSGPQTPIVEELRRCHLLVTHGSNAAFDALVAGVPIMVLGNGVTRPMSMGEDWQAIEEPFWPREEERRQFFYDLAWCQWTLEEYRSGEAWADLKATLARLGTPGGGSREERDSLSHLIEQYRIMHAHPKYFRGREAQKHFAKIGRLILAHGAKTLLDYGCGKGEQYHEPLNLHEAWGVDVAGYDPAVERFAQLPAGSFDAVICCDVMEHIPEPHVDTILRDVMARARRFAFFSIATMPASKTLPDGRNCHLTVRAESWWRERLALAREAVNPALAVEAAIYNKPVEPGTDFEEEE